MIAAPCPKCGKRVAVSLAKPDSLACDCGFAGAPTAETIRELHEASSVLGTFDARHRQLTEAQRRSFATASLRIGLTSVLLFVFVLVVAGLYRRPAPPLAAAVVGIVIIAVVVVRFTSLRRGLAAPFGGTRCRVCGDTLTGTGVVRCHHCAADNLVGFQSVADQRGSLADRVSRVASRPGR